MQDEAKSLGDPISIHSHFLFSSPLVALGYNYTGRHDHSLSGRYTLLHEYIHYEEFTSWPFLVMGYFWRCFESLDSIWRFKRNHRAVPDHWIRNIHQWKSEAVRFNSSKSQVGLDALIEAYDILNYRFKPKHNPLYSYSEKVANYLLEKPNNRYNRIHSRGVVWCENAAKDFLIEESEDLKDSRVKVLSANLPSIISWLSFGYSLLLCGFRGEKQSWHEVNDFIRESYEDVWGKYNWIYGKTLHDVFIEHDFTNLKEIQAKRDLRDLSLVGFHAFALATFSSICRIGHIESNTIEKDYSAGLVAFPLMNFLKLNEAMNRQTLLKWRVPKLWNRWVPVPAIIFPDKVMSSVRLDFDAVTHGWFMLRWQDSITDFVDYLSQMEWIRMLFVNHISDAIACSKGSIQCPVFKWAEYQYRKAGRSDRNQLPDFLRVLCNKSLNVDFSLRKQDCTISPSEDYCKDGLDSNQNKKSCLCFFHHNVTKCLASNR